MKTDSAATNVADGCPPEAVQPDADVRVERLGRGVFLAALIAFAVVALPVVRRGALLGDDFHNCIAADELGLRGFFTASWHFMGTVRPARFAEILLTSGVCRTMPFGIAILVPLSLTVGIAFLVRAILSDLGAPAWWAQFGGALWLLQPLGTEAALWPAALHVPLGLVLALIALRLLRRGRYVWGAVAAIGASLCVEQVIPALPVAAWLIVPAPRRKVAVGIAATVAIGALLVFLTWPGSDPRLRSGVIERFTGLIKDPLFVVTYPAVGLGIHSIPLAIRWALPWSIIALAAGGVSGALVASRLPVAPAADYREALFPALGVLLLVVVVNAPVLLNVPHYGSPRLFTPTWLALAIGGPWIASRMHVRYPSLIGGAVGAFAAGAMLSLAFSVWVRLVTADFNEHAAATIAALAPDDANVAVCGVRRTVTAAAPRGAFSVHEFIYEWSARDAVAYYTGRRLHFQLAGELWNRPCPSRPDVNAVVKFDDLLTGRP
jgi:hypothetical protein